MKTSLTIIVLMAAASVGCLNTQETCGEWALSDTHLPDTMSQDATPDTNEVGPDTANQDSAQNTDCPSLNPGDVFMAEGSPLFIFFVNSYGERMYFPNTRVFHTWYSDFTEIVTIPSSCAENYPAPTAPPFGINYRPGSRLIKSSISPTIYAILPGNTIAKISEEAAEAVYGMHWKSRIVTIADMFWPNYAHIAEDITAPMLHDGLMVGPLWYIKGGKRWSIEGELGFLGEDVQPALGELIAELEIAKDSVTIDEILADPSQLGLEAD